MPSVTPNRTNHGRRDVAFRGTRADPFATPAAIEKSNRRNKRILINEARALASDPDVLAAARGLVTVKRRWAKVGSAGTEHDAQLRRSFERIYVDFRARVTAKQAVQLRSAAAKVPGRVSEPAPELQQAGEPRSDGIWPPTDAVGTGNLDVEHERMGKRYGQLGTGRSSEGTDDATRIGATEPSQGTGTVPSQAQRRVGGGAVGERATPQTGGTCTSPSPLHSSGCREQTAQRVTPAPSIATLPSQGTATVPSQAQRRVGGGSVGELEPLSPTTTVTSPHTRATLPSQAACTVPSTTVNTVGGGAAGEPAALTPTVRATLPSQAACTVPSTTVNTVGGGQAGEPDAPTQTPRTPATTAFQSQARRNATIPPISEVHESE
jgi:hypothetical protein